MRFERDDDVQVKIYFYELINSTNMLLLMFI